MSPLSRLLDLPYALLAFAPLCWAGNLIVGRAVRGEIPPLSLNWWRFAVAAVILVCIVRGELWRQRSLLRRHWVLVALLSAFGITGFHSAVYVGLTATTAINAALIIAMGPLLILPLAWLILGERITVVQGVGVALSCLGVLIVITRADPAVLAELAFNRGDLWLLAASVCWGLYSVLLKRKPPEMAVLVLLTATLIVGTAFTTPLMIWELSRGLTVPATAESVAAIGYVGIFAAALAYIAWSRGVDLVGPNKAGLFLHLIPVYSAVMAAGFLGERLETHHLAGFAPILAGIFLATRFGAGTRAVRP